MTSISSVSSSDLSASMESSNEMQSNSLSPIENKTQNLSQAIFQSSLKPELPGFVFRDGGLADRQLDQQFGREAGPAKGSSSNDSHSSSSMERDVSSSHSSIEPKGASTATSEPDKNPPRKKALLPNLKQKRH